MRSPICSVVPPYLLEAMLRADDERLVEHARATLAVDVVLREQRASAGVRGLFVDGAADLAPEAPGAAVSASPGPRRTVYDAEGSTTLPGTRVRGEGDPATSDEAVTQAYDALGDTWTLYDTAYGRDSLDGHALPLLASVHYGTRYDNAFWDGSQMVFGDGDGVVFLGFTRSIDVIGHELTHGVTQYTADLTYAGQSGALNESISDVFGSLVKQRALGQAAADADWLIGAELLAPGVQGVALRSMKAPGTAYDDPRLGADPQPATMSGYVTTSADNGGVHTNSGIPNHAFYLVATAIGGNAWEAPGQIWYDVLTGPDITVDCDFATFARLTYAAALARYGAGSAEADAVAGAWEQVELPVERVPAGGPSAPEVPSAPSVPSAPPAPTPSGPTVPGPTPPGPTVPGPTPPAGARIEVRRTGGLAGMVLERTVTLADLPEHDTRHWRELLGGGELAAAAQGPTHPDAFSYDVRCSDPAIDLSIPEPALSEEARLLFERTLRP